jgi:hypothetical protein
VGKVASWLDRARLAEPVPQWERFREKVLAYVAELQAVLRKQMDAAPQTDVPPQQMGTAPTMAAPPQPKNLPPSESAVAEIETKPEDEIITGTAVSRPISNMNRATTPNIPIPDHTLMDDRYAWYLVEVRPESDYMPEIDVGDWLLVDVRHGLSGDIHDTEQRILVVKNEEISGTIRVRPLASKGPFQRIYLVDLDVPTDGLFWNDEVTGAVTFSWEKPQIRVTFSEILGVVVGFWRPMIAV